MFTPSGPANGGDGGTGGSVYISAVGAQTSLHKIARRGMIRAGRGMNGQGRLRGGQRGGDVVLEVPVGTVVREVWRKDPWEQEIERRKEEKNAKREGREAVFRDDRWVFYPGIKKKWDLEGEGMPKLPRMKKAALRASEPDAPVHLDFDNPTTVPTLLAAGALGGVGNTHFVTSDRPKPKVATRGDEALEITLTLELKLLADIGLVGLPNAGKSTLLRAVSNARARVGHWAFTTLRPNIGTVVVPEVTGSTRTHISVADIPGLTIGAHLDRGLGMAFLRHVERARALVFVVDLVDPELHPVETLKALWKEIRLYAGLREESEKAVTVKEFVPLHLQEEPSAAEGVKTDWGAMPEVVRAGEGILAKPWFVVATKADVEGSQDRYQDLLQWLKRIQEKREKRPQGEGAEVWKGPIRAFPVSAIRSEGMQGVIQWMRELVDAQTAKPADPTPLQNQAIVRERAF
ncbi:MAG: GTPase of the mitochondrial inner membrane that associates with the large ribosomal subunit [Vezdaea aestivalis]|nr:MAG: GTPase of the mitochondrial inner membrane that associates with the large ribosomal subunit [Vezdaea aestivalis]